MFQLAKLMECDISSSILHVLMMLYSISSDISKVLAEGEELD